MGSIWIVTFDPSVGTEIQKTRPALIISGTLFNNQRTKVTVLPFTSAKFNNSRISPAVVEVPASTQNGLSVDSLLICVEPMTFDKVRLTQQLGELETELLEQAQTILRCYLSLNNN
ncbi:type II toxin-antitoxin system PemK/MazF family toxin [Sphaerospermopsis torques-reginae]|uniref:mRNA interferase n=1 Tax=Sphaerospermopsis torques-reginae ITEP-024 TaxID=984208 RepID=A0ABX8X066_9CYAN|nr:type II toxin-antitoxin system PemK/MazF family toxin [Sphaerospermopsis torques-reginae]QYX32059.1 type II toxin-antitoxin system PemK/MazF family toxin [Sphaerospermopsis torques-reginae ITEP-024]